MKLPHSSRPLPGKGFGNVSNKQSGSSISNTGYKQVHDDPIHGSKKGPGYSVPFKKMDTLNKDSASKRGEMGE